MKIDPINFNLLRSDRAIVGRKEHRTDAGVGEIQYVILADGFMIDCGHGFKSEQRAAALATIINLAPQELREMLDIKPKLRDASNEKA